MTCSMNGNPKTYIATAKAIVVYNSLAIMVQIEERIERLLCDQAHERLAKVYIDEERAAHVHVEQLQRVLGLDVVTTNQENWNMDAQDLDTEWEIDDEHRRADWREVEVDCCIADREIDEACID